MRDESSFPSRSQMSVTVLYALVSVAGRHPMLVESVMTRQIWRWPLIDEGTIYLISIVGCWFVIGIDTALLAHRIPFGSIGRRLGKADASLYVRLRSVDLRWSDEIGMWEQWVNVDQMPYGRPSLSLCSTQLFESVYNNAHVRRRSRFVVTHGLLGVVRKRE